MTKYHKPGIKSLKNRSILWGMVGAGVLLMPGALARANWPGFRGPTGLGYTTETNLPLTWGGPAGENVRWTAPLPGQGHAGLGDGNAGWYGSAVNRRPGGPNACAWRA